MTRTGRGSLLTTLLALAGLAMSACATTGPAAELDAPARVMPGQGESYLALGSQLLAANEPALAMRAFNASLSLEGLSAEALTGAGIAAQRQGMLGTAREYLDHARTLAPDSAIAHSNLGVVLLGLKDYHGARTAFRSAMTLSEDDDETLRRYLERAEMAVAARSRAERDDPAATQRVVRLGSDSFRLTEKDDAGPGAATPGVPGGDGGMDEAAEVVGSQAAADAAAGEAAGGPVPTVEAGTGRRAESGAAADAAQASKGPAGAETAVLAAGRADYGAE